MDRWIGLLCGIGMLGSMPANAGTIEAGDPPVGVMLSYTVSIADPAVPEVSIVARLTAPAGGSTAIRWSLPREFAFVRLPEPLIGVPSAAAEDGTEMTVVRLNPYEWEASASAAREITLRYTVPLTHRELEAVRVRDAYEYPYLAADHGLLVTPTLFLYPTNVSPVEIRVDFELPQGWEVIAPWPSSGTRAFKPRDLQSLTHDLIAVGHWYSQEVRLGDFQAVIAIAPGQEALEQGAVDPIRRVVEYELKMFEREPHGRYLFVFGRPEVNGLAGSPKTNSMTLSVEPRLAANAAEYLGHLIAHEFFHTWTSGREIPDELRWYNEGFTDYYAYLVPARLGLAVRESFADTLGGKMAGCADNPQRGKLTLIDAGGAVFFADRDAYNLVYDGGLLLAAWLDQAIRKHDANRTLDDLMRVFNNDPRWRDDRIQPTILDFLTRVKEFAGAPAAERFERFIKTPYEFDSVAAFRELDVEIRYEEKPDVSLRANLDGTRLIDIDPRCAAYKIGLRADDRVLELNGREIEDASALRAAWRSPLYGRYRVRLRRGDQEINIDQPVPIEKSFSVPSDIWR